MTKKRDLKALIHARKAKTGESYTEARRQVLAQGPLTTTSEGVPPVKVADIEELISTLKYINSGDAHPDEIKENVRLALERFSEKRPDVLDALVDIEQLDPEDDADLLKKLRFNPTGDDKNIFDGLYERMPCGHLVMNFEATLLKQAQGHLKSHHGIDTEEELKKETATERAFHLSGECLKPKYNAAQLYGDGRGPDGSGSIEEDTPCNCGEVPGSFSGCPFHYPEQDGPEPDPHELLKAIPKDAVPKWARCTSCAEPYPIWPDRGRRCTSCGHAPVEILDLDPSELALIHDIKQNGMVPVYVNHKFWMVPNVVTYSDVLEAAGYKPERIVSVTYHGKRMKRATELEWRKPGEPVSMEPNWVRVEGILAPGQEVAACPGMMFNAADTSNA